MTRFLSPAARAAFNHALEKAGFAVASTSSSGNSSATTTTTAATAAAADITIRQTDTHLSIGNISAPLRVPKESFRVPNPLFHPNEQQTLFLREILHSYGCGEKALVCEDVRCFIQHVQKEKDKGTQVLTVSVSFLHIPPPPVPDLPLATCRKPRSWEK